MADHDKINVVSVLIEEEDGKLLWEEEFFYSAGGDPEATRHRVREALQNIGFKVGRPER